jgi:hypothetical protein
VKAFYLSLCALAMTGAAEAASPALSISRVPPASLQFSWSSNFTGWQLASTTNLTSGNWRAITQAPLTSGNALVVLLPFTNRSGFFRLQQTNSAGGCVFHAVPAQITAGASSTLNWCPVAGYTYRISPGPAGAVTGDSLIVSPAKTTVYSLTASNAQGVITNFAPVLVNPCGFANVSNWNATLTFTYIKNATAPGFSFKVNRSVNATFHLVPMQDSGGVTIFTFDSVTGNASINDEEDDSSGGILDTTTTVGNGIPNFFLSAFVLSINCANGTYNFSAIVAVDATDTEISGDLISKSPRTAITGQVTVVPRPLPLVDGQLSGSGQFPVTGLFTIPSGDDFMPNDTIANDMWLEGAVTDATAGTASVSWTITPAP